MRLVHALSLGFAAGCIGALFQFALTWFFREIGITGYYNVAIYVNPTLDWLYPRLIWGGLWGAVLFLIPYFERFYVLRGMVLGAIPALFQLFVVYPIFQDRGIMGKELGELTPLFTLLFFSAWGAAAGQWLKWAEK